MAEKHIHIISFDIPYPANYGGVQDVFYKILELHKLDVKIHLHCFKYGNRPEANELEKYCHKIYYYKRKTALFSQLSIIPYIVFSRRHKHLLANLLKDNHPILFEGLHSTFYIKKLAKTPRKLIFRESNIEHHYYYALGKAEKNIFTKMYFFVEAFKLKIYQSKLKFANRIITVSKKDKEYFYKKFPRINTYYLPSFHATNQVSINSNTDNYFLYHGNLSIHENIIAVNFILNNIANKISIPIIIAGLNPTKQIKEKASALNVKLIENPSDQTLLDLIAKAQINFLYTTQATGLKLKLLNALFNGKFCIVNSKMLHGLEELTSTCIVADTAETIIEQIQLHTNKLFTENDIQKRKNALEANFIPQNNAKILFKWVYT